MTPRGLGGMLRAMHYAPRALVLLAALSAAACGMFRAASQERDYTLVYLKTGPAKDLSKDAQAQAFAGHFANMGKLARDGRLVLAGPFGKQRSDAALRGLFVLATGDVKLAQEWASTDPAVQAGVFAIECHSLRTDAALPQFVAAEIAREDADKAAGRTPKPSDSVRGYALLVVDDFEQMHDALDGRREALLVARLDGTKGFAVVNCVDRVAAEEAFASVRGQLGEHRFEEWFASTGLAQLPSMR